MPQGIACARAFAIVNALSREEADGAQLYDALQVARTPSRPRWANVGILLPPLAVCELVCEPRKRGFLLRYDAAVEES